jgi:hypothetical protein
VIVNHRTIAVLRAAALVPLVSLALLGVALAVAGGELTTLLVRVGFLIVAAGVVTGALRWSVLPSVSPPLVAGIVALWVLALSGAAEIGGSIVLVATAAVVALVALRHVRPTEAADAVRPAGASRLRGRSVEEQLAGRSTAELCRVWADTGAEIARATRPDLVARLLQVREAVLAELERRDPSGVRRWLDTNPAATSNPRSFVREQHEPPQQAA